MQQELSIKDRELLRNSARKIHTLHILRYRQIRRASKVDIEVMMRTSFIQARKRPYLPVLVESGEQYVAVSVSLRTHFYSFGVPGHAFQCAANLRRATATQSETVKIIASGLHSTSQAQRLTHPTRSQTVMSPVAEPTKRSGNSRPHPGIIAIQLHFPWAPLRAARWA